MNRANPIRHIAERASAALAAGTPSMDAIINWLRERAPAAQLSANSRQIARGDVFFALRTPHGDGRAYIEAAIIAGAAAVVYEAEDFEWDGRLTLPHLAVSGLLAQAGAIASTWYDAPAAPLYSVAVTGTNGKTSCTQWLAKALSLAKCDSAVIGTLGHGLYKNGLAGSFTETGYTTPDAISLQRSLVGLRAQGAEALAIEASSIGLAEARLAGLHIDVAVFTNLTRDHLDYHGDMVAYGAAKRQLFDAPELAAAVLNLDDAFGADLVPYLQARNPQLRLLGYRIEGAATLPAESHISLLRASHLKASHGGTSFHLDSRFGSGLVKTQLIGRFNVSNILAVLAVLLDKGVSFSKALAIVEKLPPVAGRMQLLGTAGHVMVVIDYAHTPDALEKTLLALQSVAQERGGQLWCVFGCGGDRDPGKRPQMGKVAQLAAQVVLTNDNPRSEAPSSIIAEIVAGMDLKAHIVEDRANAILYAIKHAGDHDVVLLAGKGHETYQEIAGKKSPFSDEEHAALALATIATNGNMKRGN